jgi:hypothetical protein
VSYHLTAVRDATPMLMCCARKTGWRIGDAGSKAVVGCVWRKRT